MILQLKNSLCSPQIFTSRLDLFSYVVDDIVERYDNLSKSVSDRNEKLQITLTRSMSVQDGLDEMMRWMEAVEASVEEKGPLPLDSASIGDILSREAVCFFDDYRALLQFPMFSLASSVFLRHWNKI